MNALKQLLEPLRHLAAALFKHDVALRTERGEVHIVLQDRHAKGHQPKERRDEQIARRQTEELMQIRTELAALLNELPETRGTMRHLVFVEQAMAKKGLRVLHKLPLDVLQRAHEQLENLVTNWSPVGLANLRSKMAVAIIDREHMDPAAEGDAYRTAAVLDVDRPGPETDTPASEIGEDEALAAAYAALGAASPLAVEMQGDLGSASGRSLARPAAPHAADTTPEIELRTLQA
jgi:hypothetical protein